MRKTGFICALVLMQAMCLLAQNQEKDFYNRAEARYDAGQYMNALDLYNEFLAAFPLSDSVSDAQYRRAVCFVMLGKYDDALSLFKRIETAYRGTRFVRYLPYWTGIVLYQKKEYPKAIESFETYLSHSSAGESDADAYYYKGLSSVGMGSYKEASDSFASVEKKYPSFKSIGSVLVLRSYSLFMAGEYTLLLEYADHLDVKLLAQTELNSVLFYKAEALYRTGAIEAAGKLYDSLFAKDSDIAAEAFIRLFTIARNANDFTRVEALMQRAETLFPGRDPRMSSVRLSVGIEYFKKGNYELSKYYLSSLWNARQQDPVDEAVPVYLAETYVKTKDYQSAEKILAEYVSAQKNVTSKIVTRLGYVYILEKKYKEARDLFSSLVSKSPMTETGFDPYYYLAFAYYKTGETEKGLDITETVTAQNKAGALDRDFFKLHILLLEKAKQTDKAFTSLRQYVSLYPDDVRSRVDLCEMLLAKKDYDGIVREAEDAKKANRELAKNDPYSYIVLTYLEGLSRIGVKAYKNAIDYLDLIQKESLDSAQLSALYPYTLFYKGWALYKLVDYKNATQLFATVADKHPQSGLQARSLYLSGWCLYSSNDFDGAIKYFTLLADLKADTTQKDRALFFEAKSLLNLKKTEDAKAVFKSVFSDFSKSELADDAMFEYAGILDSQGRAEDAASSFLKISSSYPASPVAEDGLYRRAEVYFTNKMYEKAKNAFYDYRTKYPNGKLLDASLYWGGLATYSLGEKSLAILLWERIVNELKGSTYRANALIKTAEVYSDSSEYSKALSLYTELLMKYPVEASSVNAEEKTATLKYLVLGLSKKEAEFVASVERNGRDKTSEGRKAIVDLARLYMTEFGKEKLEVAYSMLVPVLGHVDDVDAVSDAQYLVGEYYYIKGDFVKAGNEFVKAAVLSTNNKDRMAHSIFRAAEMMKMGGNTKDALDLVDRLEKSFPQSDWTIEGRKLVKGLQR